MAHDGKKIGYFVKKCSEQSQIIKTARDQLVALKVEWTAANPNVAEEPVVITAQQAADFNTFKNAIDDAIENSSTIIDGFKAISDALPSHNAGSMSDWD